MISRRRVLVALGAAGALLTVSGLSVSKPNQPEPVERTGRSEIFEGAIIDADDPSFDQYVQVMLKQVARGLGTPYERLVEAYLPVAAARASVQKKVLPGSP